MNAIKSLSSFVLAAGIIATGWYLRQRRDALRGPCPSQTSSIVSGIPNDKHILVEDVADHDLRTITQRKIKAELHCHLNGSVRRSTVSELIGNSEEADTDGIVHTIDDAFREFKRVYRAINSEKALRRIVRETLEDALNDNVRYLELRTTPRKLSDIPSRKDYVHIVVDEIRRFDRLNVQRPLQTFPDDTIAVRLILTVDRTQPPSLGDQTVDIALRYPEIVVGIDFAGNPTVGSFSDFVSVFTRAKGHGLFTTVHTSEIQGVEEETQAILEFRPNRIGHFLFPTEAQVSALIDRGISIEACPTSNICAISGKSPEDGNVDGHHIIKRFIRDSRGLLSINTDDPGVFGKTLSEEMFAVAKTFKLTREEIDRMLISGAKQAFLSLSERVALEQAILES